MNRKKMISNHVTFSFSKFCRKINKQTKPQEINTKERQKQKGKENNTD